MTLYDLIVIKACNITQQVSEAIWKAIENEKNDYSKYWATLTSPQSFGCDKLNNKIRLDELGVNHGSGSNQVETDKILLTKLSPNEKKLNSSDTENINDVGTMIRSQTLESMKRLRPGPKIDAQKQLNKAYLARDNVKAFYFNQFFHDAMKKVTGIINETGITAKYKSAPIKKYARCEQKLIKYKGFPEAKCVLDWIRGSVVFDNCKDMVNGIQEFENFINSHENDTIIKKILQKKNGMTETRYFKNSNDCCYVDFKAIVSLVDIVDGVRMQFAGEIQFQLKSINDAKGLSHMVHNYTRDCELQEQIKHALDHECDPQRFESSIISAIKIGNKDRIIKLVWRNPEKVLSMRKKGGMPLVVEDHGYINNLKLMYSNVLKHFGPLMAPRKVGEKIIGFEKSIIQAVVGHKGWLYRTGNLVCFFFLFLRMIHLELL